MEMSGQLHSPAASPAGKETLVTHWIGRLEGPGQPERGGE